MQSIKRVGGSWVDHTTRELGALLGSVVGRKKGHAQPQAGWGSEYGPDTTCTTVMHCQRPCQSPTSEAPTHYLAPACSWCCVTPISGPYCTRPCAKSCSNVWCPET